MKKSEEYILQNNEWNIVNLSTPESIMGLLKFRWKFDPLYNQKRFNFIF